MTAQVASTHRAAKRGRWGEKGGARPLVRGMGCGRCGRCRAVKGCAGGGNAERCNEVNEMVAGGAKRLEGPCGVVSACQGHTALLVRSAAVPGTGRGRVLALTSCSHQCYTQVLRMAHARRLASVVLHNACSTAHPRNALIDIAVRRFTAQGELAFELETLSGVPATVVDPRPMQLERYVRRLQVGHSTTHRTWLLILCPAPFWMLSSGNR